MASHSRPLRIAVEGCGHGELHAIYTSIQQSCKAKGWDGVDLVIIGGDFQACRNNHDMNWMAVPPKYRAIRDFHEYYSGHRLAPYLTIFVGGNHEASNHLQELYYGGWVAPNIYYMGAANVISVGGVRIAGMSGIWKGYDYRKPHYLLSSLDDDDVKQIYHTREIDVRRLLALRSQVDIGISHDWPKGVEHDGNLAWLLRVKRHLVDDVNRNALGSNAARYVLDYLRPFYWFSAHLHIKYAATIHHAEKPAADPSAATKQNEQYSGQATLNEKGESDLQGPASADGMTMDGETGASDKKAATPSADLVTGKLTTGISNNITRFLALDKCMPRKEFLQLMEIPPKVSSQHHSSPQPLQLEFDPEWLAITRVFSEDLKHKDKREPRNIYGPQKKSREFYAELIDKEMDWIKEHVVRKNRLEVPQNFQRVAPIYDRNVKFKNPNDRPAVQPNPQTEAFCEMLQISDPLS